LSKYGLEKALNSEFCQFSVASVPINTVSAAALYQDTSIASMVFLCEF